MDTLKTDKTDTAEAENIETMELLTGMLDNATQCGGTDLPPQSFRVRAAACRQNRLRLFPCRLFTSLIPCGGLPAAEWRSKNANFFRLRIDNAMKVWYN